MADGAYGRLWKESDHGGLVVLLTRCDGYKAKSVQVLSNGQVIATLAYSSAANPDQCGNRDHFRHPKHAASFPPNILLLVTTTKNEKRCYDIGPRPGSRVD
ncbi:MAG: hypothetical protein KDD64_14815 [Bdellovibrionales bacterium]|nr:hypothetical protein [Bdellovibrionales bacterium]